MKSLVLTMAELKELIESIEKFPPYQDELESTGNEDQVVLHIIRSPTTDELIYKVIH